MSTATIQPLRPPRPRQRTPTHANEAHAPISTITPQFTPPITALVTLLGLALACGDPPAGEVAVDAVRVVRVADIASEVGALDRREHVILEWTVVDPKVDPGPLQIVRRADSAVTNPLHRLVRKGAGGEHPEPDAVAFGVTGSGPRIIALPMRSDADRVDQVRVTAFVPGLGDQRARALLLDDASGVIRSSQWQSFNRRELERELEFMLGPAQGSEVTRRVDRVAIEFDGRPGFASLLQITAYRTLPGAELPQVGRPELVTIEDRSRWAAGLIEGHPWRFEADLEAGARLHLSIHRPVTYQGGSRRPSLAVEVKRGDHEVRLESALTEAAHAGWYDMSVELTAGAIAGARVEIALLDDAEGTGAVLLGDATLCSPVQAPRTVLLITSDTHRADYIGAGRSPSIVSTPWIDGLARRGLMFEDCQSTTNVTSPSHIAMMTGVHPKDSEIINNRTQLTSNAVTLAEIFRGAGFMTFAAVSVGHLVDSRSGLGQGFDRFALPEDATDRADKAVRVLDAWLEDAGGEDVFLWLHLFDAHSPYAPPRGVRADSGESGESRIRPADLGGAEVPGWIERSEAASVEQVRSWYAAEVEALDGELATLFGRPRMDSAWIAFTSDHGEGLGENNIWFTHSGLYPPTIQVPLIIAGPGVPNERTAAPVQQLDLGRTLLDLAGIERPFPGRSLLDRARSAEIDEPRFALSSHGYQAGITSGHWLLTLDLLTMENVPPETRTYEAGRVRLFDRRMGPIEDPSLLEKEWELATRLRNRLVAWLEEESTSEAMSAEVELSDSEADTMRQLGYADSAVERGKTWWNPSRITDEAWKGRFEEHE